MKKVAMLMVAFSVLVGCSKDLTDSVNKNPPQLESIPEAELTRTKIADVVLSSSMISALDKADEDGFDAAANCLQWVEIKKGEESLGNFLEVSGKACPTEGLIADADVIVRLSIKQHNPYFTQYRLSITDSSNELKEMGVFRKLTTTDSNGTTVTYVLEGLCDISQSYDESDDWAGVC